jgi:hypothetical protein
MRDEAIGPRTTIVPAVGLADRDYMKRQGKSDPYYDQLFQPSRSTRATTDRHWSASTPASGRRRSIAPYLVTAAILFGLFVLPHLTINGRHYTLWVL